MNNVLVFVFHPDIGIVQVLMRETMRKSNVGIFREEPSSHAGDPEIRALVELAFLGGIMRPSGLKI